MEIIITAAEAEQRVDRFCRKYFKPYPEITLSNIYTWIRKGVIKVNGRKAKENYKLQIDDTITFYLKDPSAEKLVHSLLDKDGKEQLLTVEEIRQYLIAEDENWLVRNKPAGTVTHPGDKHTVDLSLHDYFLRYLELTGQASDSPTFSPSFCFRLDKDTSGIIIAAKTYPALQELNQRIREHKVSKSYTTILVGNLANKITNKKPIFVGYNKSTGRSQSFINEEKGKDAETTFMPIEQQEHPLLGAITLCQAIIKTGRMHQIRVHAADLGYPVVGDITYGNPAINRIASNKLHITRQLLHSSTYGFFDSFAHKQRQFTAPLPEIFCQLFPGYGTDFESID